MDYTIDNSKPWYHIDKKLIPVKVVNFTYFGGMQLMFPYLPVLMKLLGLTTAQITIIYSILPLLNFLGPPLSGLLADKLGKHKLVTVMVLILTCCFFTTLLSVPGFRAHEPRTFTLSCNESQVLLNISQCSTPAPCSSFVNYSFCPFIEQNSTKDVCKSSVCHISEWRQLPSNANASCVFLANKRETALSNSSSCDHNCFAFSHCTESEGNQYLTFLLYLALRFCCQAFLTSCYNLVDATLIAVIRKRKAGYVRQRLWIHVSQAAMPPLVGLFVDRISRNTGKTYLWPVFVCFDVMLMTSVIVISSIKVKIDSIKGRFLPQIRNAFISKHSLYLYCICAALGFFPGFYSNFLSIYLHEMKSSMSVIGLTAMSAAVASIPVMLFGDALIYRLGHINVMIGCFFLQAIRFISISYITAPWVAIPIETLRALSQNLCWVSILTYSSAVAPKGLMSTVTGLVRALYYGLGRGSGALIGGTIMTQLPTRITFRILGGAAIVVGIFFALVYYLWLRKFPIQKNNEVDEKQEPLKECHQPMIKSPTKADQ